MNLLGGSISFKAPVTDCILHFVQQLADKNGLKILGHLFLFGLGQFAGCVLIEVLKRLAEDPSRAETQGLARKALKQLESK